MDTRKYIFENGVMKLNPAYKAPAGAAPQVSTANPNALAIVSSTNDIAMASQAQQQATGRPMQLADATVSSMQIMQDTYYTDKFQAGNKVDGGQILDGLSNIFARYEVPVGLINKLLALTEYKLRFTVDDSGSMQNQTDALVGQASPFMRQKIDPRKDQGYKQMTRWEEAEDRLHVMIDMLAYIPSESITINFLNRPNQIVLSHSGKSTDQFAQDAHQQISNAFMQKPCNSTPLYGKLSQSLQAGGNTMHYILTDGVPTDASVEKVKELVRNRPNPKMSPITFMSCTNDDSECDWMKEVEEAAPYTAELDDYESEKREVLHDQGPGLPFTRGFWLLCQLCAAINPDDLDALDESNPFSKMTLDNLMGRKLTQEEYGYYWRSNPNANKYQHLYNQFSREDISARQILGNQPQGQYYNQNTNYNPQMWGQPQQPQPNQQGQNYYSTYRP